MVTKAIENAQKKVEARNFDIRKHLLEYDDVMNQQRGVIYSQRRQILQGEGLTDIIFDMTGDILDNTVSVYCGKDIYSEDWDIKGLKEALLRQFSLTIHDGEIDFNNTGVEGLKETLIEKTRKAYDGKEGEFGSEIMRQIERMVLLQVVDTHWKDHLLTMDHLKEGIGLRGYGQKDPLIEYKREGFEMFNDMISRIKSDTVERLFKVQLVKEEPVQQRRPPPPPRRGHNRGEQNKHKTAPRRGKKVGRNDPCPCGSGKKYKKCCGR
jgi:preprotein translocase subunit SecA